MNITYLLICGFSSGFSLCAMIGLILLEVL